MDISFQLYSARNHPLDSTLSLLAALGYAQVEGFGGVLDDLPRLKGLLDANGLAMPTAHIGLDALERPQETLRTAETLGLEAVICPWLAPGQRPADRAGWQALGARLQELARPYRDAGLTFGYHNHDFEFAPVEGGYAMDALLSEAPDVGVEADVAWLIRGGADAADWLARNGARIFAVHVKDIAPEGENLDEDGWADVGHGVVPWRELFRVIDDKAEARYLIVEHDNPSDLERFATRSLAAVKSFGA